MSNVIHNWSMNFYSRPEVKLLEVYADGSGAPATVTVDGHCFSADFLGAPKLTCITGRKPARRTVDAAKRAYSVVLGNRVSAGWLALNGQMYPVVD